MPRPSYVLDPQPQYTEEVPALLDSDPASASRTFNPLVLAVLNNIKAVKLLAEGQGAEYEKLSGKADRAELAALTSDFAHLVFQMHLRDLLDAQGLDFVEAQEFDTPGALELLQGRFEAGKAYI